MCVCRTAWGQRLPAPKKHGDDNDRGDLFLCQVFISPLRHFGAMQDFFFTFLLDKEAFEERELKADELISENFPDCGWW